MVGRQGNFAGTAGPSEGTNSKVVGQIASGRACLRSDDLAIKVQRNDVRPVPCRSNRMKRSIRNNRRRSNYRSGGVYEDNRTDVRGSARYGCFDA
jgi:hypothetical protein